MPALIDPTRVARGDRGRTDRLLFERYLASGDAAQRDQLIERFLPLARTIAARFARPLALSDDVHQIACLGLVKAVDRFDPARGTAFSTFAVPTISGEIRRYFRDSSWSVRPPRELAERALRVEAAAHALTGHYGRSPTVASIAEHLGDLDEEAVLEARQARQAMDAASLQGRPADDQDTMTHEDRLGASDAGYERAENREMLQRLLESLSQRERDVMVMRFAGDMTQAEIGKRIGVSQMQISRIVRGALARMRTVAARDAAEAREPDLATVNG